MPIIHFLNVLEGDCNIIQHDIGDRVTVIDVSNAYNDYDTPEERAVKVSKEREEMRTRTLVPSYKVDYRQKLTPDNPIEYLRENIGTSTIFRFIMSHPDMDHMDGIKDLFDEFQILNFWDTANNKTIDPSQRFPRYNPEDWRFYGKLRSGVVETTKRLTLYDNESNLYWNEDRLHILSPNPGLVQRANESGDYNDASYVILFTPPRKGGGVWKIIFAGDSDDHSWDHILANHGAAVSNVDILFAPHHGRDSSRKYDFLDVLDPKVTLFGNADSKHLAYACYPGPPYHVRITNNQAGYVVMDVMEDCIDFYVKNFDFARDFRSKPARQWPLPLYSPRFKAYELFSLS